MKIHSQVSPLQTIDNDVLFIAIPAQSSGADAGEVNAEQIEQSAKLPASLKALDGACADFFTKHSGYLPKRSNSIRTFYNTSCFSAPVVAVIAVDNTLKGVAKAAEAIVSHLRAHELRTASIAFAHEAFSDVAGDKLTSLLAQYLVNADYRFEQFKTQTDDKAIDKNNGELTIAMVFDKVGESQEKAIKEGVAIANGMKRLRDLGNMPGNHCTPRYLAKVAKEIAKTSDKLNVEVLKKSDIEALNMGALLAVSQGSSEPPRLIKMQYKGSDDAPVIFVGKGVTFDTGGISLKPAASMDEMKYDMCGAGSVIALMQVAAELELPIHLMAIVPAVENMPSGKAIKPGDIVTSMSGKTIEILNTDAEGRLILCDALTYAQQFNPKQIIDLATLTGAAIIALGHQASCVMSNDDSMAEAIVAAGERRGDRAWRLPIWDEYAEQLKSPYADLQNIGGRSAGTITAGCFLAEFTKSVSWAHIDIAGTAWVDRKGGASGRPVPLLTEYVTALIAKS